MYRKRGFVTLNIRVDAVGFYWFDLVAAFSTLEHDFPYRGL